MKSNDEEIRFVARHYRKGLFSPDEGWRRLGIVSTGHSLRRLRAAAAVAAIVILSATATVLYRLYDRPQAPVEISTGMDNAPVAGEVKVIDFENVPLPMVIDRICTVYGVEVMNVPADAEEYRLTLNYEGTAADLVMTINDILGTEMHIAEQ